MCSANSRLTDDSIVVMAQRLGIDIEMHVRQCGEQFVIRGRHRVVAIGDLTRQLGTCRAVFERRQRGSDVVPILGLEMRQNGGLPRRDERCCIRVGWVHEVPAVIGPAPNSGYAQSRYRADATCATEIRRMDDEHARPDRRRLS